MKEVLIIIITWIFEKWIVKQPNCAGGRYFCIDDSFAC